MLNLQEMAVLGAVREMHYKALMRQANFLDVLHQATVNLRQDLRFDVKVAATVLGQLKAADLVEIDSSRFVRITSKGTKVFVDNLSDLRKFVSWLTL